MTFLMSLLIMLSKTMGLNNFEELYEGLLGLGIITNVEFLKWLGQCSTRIQALAMLVK